jgi:hypothetical protein
MKIAVHITFFYNKSRFKYIKEVVENLLEIDYLVDIFIYTNKKFDLFENIGNVNLLIYPYLSSKILKFPFNSIFNNWGLKQLIHPYYLTWEHRQIVVENIDQYDIQIYLEDDIKFTSDNLKYWLTYNEIVLSSGYNLGFLRTEFDGSNKFITDLTKPLTNIISINEQKFIVNDINPYCGFWIYSKKELKEFIKSEEWFFKFKPYGIREKAAIGWHGKNMTRYKNTIIPLIENNNELETIFHSNVHHLPNNYINHKFFCKIKFPIIIANLYNKL